MITHSFNDQTAVPYIQGIKVNVSGGLFKGDGKAVFVDAKQEADEKYLESGFITGGYYTSDVKAYVVDGYHCIATPDSDPNQKEYPYMIGTAHVKPIEEKKKTEIKEQAQSDAGKKAGHELSEPEKVKVAEKVNSVIEQIQNNNAVAQVDTKANDAVIKNTILKNHKADLGSATDLINADTTIAIELKQVEVTKVIGQQITEATQVTVGKAVYNVEPVATVTTEERDSAGNVIKTETKEITLTNEGYTLSKDDDTYTIAKKDDSGKRSDNANTGIIESHSTTPIVKGLIAMTVVGLGILLIRRKKERE